MRTRILKRPKLDTKHTTISVTDLLVLLELLLLSVFALFVPERYWFNFCFGYEWFKWKVGRFKIEKILEGRNQFSRANTFDALSIGATRIEHHTQIMREVILGWKPDIALIGGNHIEAALARGRGAVLWIAHLSFNSLATKKALNAAGYRVYHISRPEHGFSKTLFGMHVLNRIRVQAEKPYLVDRIVIDRKRPACCMHQAMDVLRQNMLVSITSGAWEGQKVVATEIFGAELEIAAGAPRLAYSSGSILLPVFTIRSGKSIDVIIGEPLEPKGLSRDNYVKAATATFAKQTAEIVLLHPEQWRDWEKLKPGRTPQSADGESPKLSIDHSRV